MLEQKKLRVALLTNIVAPYRIPVYLELSKVFQLRVFISGREDNRANWSNARRTAKVTSLDIRESWGFTMRFKRVRGREVWNLRYLHLNPGYIVDLLRFRPAAVISTEMGFRTVMALVYGAFLKRPAWVWWGGTPHTERARGGIRRFVRKMISRLVPRWISYGLTSTEYLLSLGIPRDRILQTQNCVDERLYSIAVAPTLTFRVKPVLLYVGQMIGRKGVRLLLDSAARIQHEGYSFTLLVVGSGPEKHQLEDYAVERGLNNVEFYTPYPPEAMPGIYRSADYLVFPTLEDVWGLVVNEALLSGLPVLGSVYAGCTPEVVPEPNRFDPLNPEDFDRAMRLAVTNRLSPVDNTVLLTIQQVAERIIADVQEWFAE